jgi:SAM-dependent methyltransferase
MGPEHGQEMTAAIERELREFSGTVGEGSMILDVGCGNRPYQRFFAHCEYVGIDVETSGRKTADKEADRFYDGENIPFPDGHFHIILCTQVFEHCRNPDKLMRDIHRVLKPEGRLFFSVPFLWGEHEVPYDFRRYTSFGSKKFLEENGFRIHKQVKADEGVDAIRTLVNSELNYSRIVNLSKPGVPALFGPLLDGLARVFFECSLRIWKRRSPFARVYLDNIVVASRS